MPSCIVYRVVQTYQCLAISLRTYAARFGRRKREQRERGRVESLRASQPRITESLESPESLVEPGWEMIRGLTAAKRKLRNVVHWKRHGMPLAESQIAPPIVLIMGAELILDFLSVDLAKSMLRPYQALAGFRR